MPGPYLKFGSLYALRGINEPAGWRRRMKNRITGPRPSSLCSRPRANQHLFGNPSTPLNLPIMPALKDHPDLT